jgi:DNA-binding transcriptional MerR regulator
VEEVATTLTIADAAKASGLSAHALRYYEKAGLREPVDRNGSGRRYGGDRELEWKIYYYREQLERQ